MIITIRTNELNARRNNVAIVNSFVAEVSDAPLTGTEKQVSWAEDIRAKSIAMLVKRAIDQLTGSNGTHYDAEKLDAAIAKINAEFAPMIAAKIAGITQSKVWIETRGMDAARVAQAGVTKNG